MSVSTEKDPSDKKSDDSKAKKDAPMASVGETMSFVFGCNAKVIFLFWFGCAASVANGCVYPALAYIFSNSFSSITAAADGLAQVRELAFIFLIVGGAALVAAFLQNGCLEIVAYHAARSFRLQWFKALLRQDTAFFDVYDVSGIASTIGSDSKKYRRGLGAKFGEFIQFTVNAIGGIAYAFYSSWRTAFVVLAALPFVCLAAMATLKVNQRKSAVATEAYSKASSVAYSTVSSIKTVLSLNAIPEMIRQYSNATLEAYKTSIKLLWKAGFTNGSMLGSFILLYCILTLFGSWLIYRDVADYGCDPSASVDSNETCGSSGPDVFGAMLGVAFAAQGLSQTGNFVAIFTEARVACYSALKAIRRSAGAPQEEIYEDAVEGDEDVDEGGDLEEAKGRQLKAILPEYVIDSSSRTGLKPETIKGAISFKNVGFSYPTRPHEQILNGFNLEIEAGKTVALVGPSGGGKSTTVSLLERFYDPQNGSIELDGIDIKKLNVKHLRSSIGYVGQEPTLFATTIAGNIKYGRPDATQEEIEAAAKMANAHDFISALPDKYETQCGDKGSHLSGGQKQRIAIARVLVANPRILLLDEATSALDSESELVVQEALDSVLTEHKRTTIVIAHRLSTVRDLDVICYAAQGRILEQGTHDELMAIENGHYKALVDAQERRASTRNSSRDSSYSDLRQLDDSESIEVTDVPDVGSSAMVPHFNFKDVTFAYPTRPKKPVFEGFNLSIRQGETLALVGPSGGGKSTTVALLERFYDPAQGSIEYCGVDIRTLNLKWYRDQIGYVGQEPTLFSASIAENIAYGAEGVTREEIEQAAMQANAHDFITKFTNGYETQVGQQQGTQLSGGQKQRVAIARALVKKPKVLILDEATSALDNESESIVQDALDKIMESKEHTIIVIAHRLSSIQSASRIAVIENQMVQEIGTHEELINKHHGRYKRLVEAQTRRKSIEVGRMDETADDSDEEDENPDFVAEIEAAEKKAFDSKRARKMARPDAYYMLVGSIGAILAGGVFPTWGIMFGETISLLFRRIPDCETDIGGVPCEDFYDAQAEDMRRDSFAMAIYWVIIAVACVVGNMLVFYGFGMASERLNKRVRDSAFTALIRQEVAFYDKRSVGALTSQLSDDAARIHTFSGEPVRSLLVALSSVLTGLIVSFIFMWPFALLSVACIPVMGAATAFETKKFLGEDESEANQQDELNSPGGIAVETLLNIKTVAALTLEEQRYKNYENAVNKEQPHYVRDSFVGGFMSGMSMAVQQWVNALQFWWGGWILFNYPNLFSFDDFLIAMFSLLFSLFGLGAAFQGISDKKETERSAGRIFYLLDRKSEIDPMSEEGKKLD